MRQAFNEKFSNMFIFVEKSFHMRYHVVMAIVSDRFVLSSHPEMSDERRVSFRYRGASAYLSIVEPHESAGQKVAFLYEVFSKNRGQGEATKLLAEIVAYCKEENLPIWLDVEPYESGNNGLNKEQLIKFYSKFGAKVVETTYFTSMEINP